VIGAFGFSEAELNRGEANCPCCKLIVSIGEKDCSHCHHFFSEQELEALSAQAEKSHNQIKSSMKFWVIALTCIIAVLMMIGACVE